MPRLNLSEELWVLRVIEPAHKNQAPWIVHIARSGECFLLAEFVFLTAWVLISLKSSLIYNLLLWIIAKKIRVWMICGLIKAQSWDFSKQEWSTTNNAGIICLPECSGYVFSSIWGLMGKDVMFFLTFLTFLRDQCMFFV